MKCSILIWIILLTAGFTNFSHAESGDFAVTERGASYRILQRTTMENGTNRVHRYTEFATGLNYTNSSGQWIESKEEIDILPNGTAQAVQGQHQATFPGDIYQGEIDLVSPNGQLHSRPLCLRYLDGENSVLIAELTNSIGVVVGSNQVIYPNAFTAFKADLRYTYKKSGFEQEIVFQEQPPSPESLGLNPQTARLQLLTEFFNTDEPAQAETTPNQPDGLHDTTLAFGSMKMIQGKAFSIGDQETSRRKETPVYKSWLHLDGRTFLVEELPYRRIEAQLEQLPVPVGGNLSANSIKSSLYKVSAKHLLPQVRLVQASTNVVQFARADLHYKSGVVLDYVGVDNYYTNGDFTFGSNQTYYISGFCEIDGTAIFQGGTVLKYAAGADLYIGGAECQTGPYNMATFTAKDDDSIGEIISGSTGTPSGYYAYPALDFMSGGGQLPSLSYLRFCYCAIVINNPGADIGFDLLDSQLIKCDMGVSSIWLTAYKPAFSIRNVLIDQIGTAAFCGEDFDAYVENLTVSGINAGVSKLASAVNDVADYSLTLVNCLGTSNIYWGFDGITLAAGTCCFSNLTPETFQAAGAGNYYLAADSPYRNAGTASVDAVSVNGPLLLPELRQKTTYPPNTISGDFSASIRLNPRVPRDTDAIDPGYHYDALDYLAGSLTVETGVTLTLTNGAALCLSATNLIIDGTLIVTQQICPAIFQDQQTSASAVLVGGRGYLAYFDADADGLPDWWENTWFGNLNQSATNDADGDGTLNLQEYQNDINPNKISFFFSVASQYVTTNLVNGAITILGGVPSKIAVLVDTNNFTGAFWTNYTGTNLTIDIGTNQGVHDVWVGLRGLPADAQPTWQETTVILDSMPPTIAITNPASNASFNLSRINVQGNFTSGALRQITVNGMPAFISGTNFSALNVPLDAGTNIVTAILEDFTGMTNAASIIVIGLTNSNGSMNDPVLLQATPVAGFVPLTVTFQITSNSAPGTFQQARYDFNGDGITDFVTNNLNSFTCTYATNGEYFPTVTIQTTAGTFSSSGGWNSFDPDRLQVTVQAALTQTVFVTINDPVDLKWIGTNLYVLSGSDQTITEFNTNASTARTLTLGASSSGFDVDAAGNVYVALTASNQVWKFFPTNSSFLADTNFGTGGFIGNTNGATGNNTNEFNAPFDVAVSPDGGTIAVSDSGNNRIQQFSASNGVFTTTFGTNGTDIGQFNSPKGLTYDNVGTLYIVDSVNNRIAIAQGSSVIGVSGTNGAALGQFSNPINVSVNNRGVYVADTGNNRIQSFGPAAPNSLFSINPSTIRFGISTNLDQPQSIAAVRTFTNEMFYVADTGNNRVLLYQMSLDSPLPVWNNMTSHVAIGDIAGAAQFFSITSADKYRQAFLSIGASDLILSINQIGTVTVDYIGADGAECYFTKTIGGQVFTFPVKFNKENGVWKILEF